MHYVQYHKEVVQRYGIKLVGWTHPSFINPSEMSTSLPPLQALLDAIESGSCEFVRLTPDQKKEENGKYREKIRPGEIIVPERATRKDKGKKRKCADNPIDSRDEDDGMGTPGGG